MATATFPIHGPSVEAHREAMGRLTYQIEYLRRRQDNGRKKRFALLSDVATGITAFADHCDLPGGYGDPEDPFAPDAIGILRSEFEDLRTGSYPVPEGEPTRANGRRI